MRKFKYSALLALPLVFSCVAEAAENANNYTLEQVVVFSRHGLRAPLASPSSALGKVTPNEWPQWDTPSSYLTTRGGALEAYFGHYFSEWLVDTKLLQADVCPTEKDVYFYANSLQRTIATAQYFSVGAFPGCIVPVYHKEKLGTMDATFNPIIRNDTPEFKQKAIDSINAAAGPGGVIGLNERLKPIYEDMSKVINYGKSATCTVDKQCDFLAQPTTINITASQEPGISGPLRTGTSVADAFILQYYEGSPLSDVAWGQIKNNEQFEKLVSIKEYYNTVNFSAPVVAKEVSTNLINYIHSVFDNKDAAKFTFLVGHDSNVASMFATLGVKPYNLPNQFETTPIGGKILFERWKDNTTGEQLLKIEYVYQSTDQLRKLEQLNRENPPQRVVLELASCPINAMGYCSFDKFENLLNELAK
ncbi:bifunctional glucose-1-phosphatase/inositol phosphatase [Zophobihabitans entericus]|uniref:Bifunctional glucose-1-phosphatase/inositol phosphatase n=1 Tax=Zophobihabitans entericus TaxID=1635327 RepID=A0A6G9IC36_9GAMM|nr:bifunctional glucose-1-phosphatase/inositol phosphatase [Zophobihabitans entericus]QIQ21274.1 bifunctional glucose-1-phosphatase/inositol phosphatase [Zophobihabitans entericus]